MLYNISLGWFTNKPYFPYLWSWENHVKKSMTSCSLTHTFTAVLIGDIKSNAANVRTPFPILISHFDEKDQQFSQLVRICEYSCLLWLNSASGGLAARIAIATLDAPVFGVQLSWESRRWEWDVILTGFTVPYMSNSADAPCVRTLKEALA